MQLAFRNGTTDLNVFFEIFYAQVYRTSTAIAPVVILDLGANIGLASVYFACIYPEAKIYAFELVPENAARACWHIEQNEFSQIYLISEGVADFSGMVGLSSPPPGRFGDYSMLENGSEQIRLAPVGDAAELFDRLQISFVDLLKIDVEGAEHAILPRLADKLPHIGKIVGEIHGPEVVTKATLDFLAKTHDVITLSSGSETVFHFQATLRPNFQAGCC